MRPRGGRGARSLDRRPRWLPDREMSPSELLELPPERIRAALVARLQDLHWSARRPSAPLDVPSRATTEDVQLLAVAILQLSDLLEGPGDHE